MTTDDPRPGCLLVGCATAAFWIAVVAVVVWWLT